MSVRSERMRARPRFSWNRAAAIVAWLGGTFTTYLFFALAAPALAWPITVIIAALTQWVLTMVERPLWRWIARRPGGRFVPLAIVVTIGDGILNAAGLFPQMGRLAKTGVGTMLAEVLNVQPVMGARAAFLVAFVLGLVIAALPEALWEADSY